MFSRKKSKEAFVSDGGVTKTLLHELYGLDYSRARSEGVSGERAMSETRAAFDFSKRGYREIEGRLSRP